MHSPLLKMTQCHTARNCHDSYSLAIPLPFHALCCVQVVRDLIALPADVQKVTSVPSR
jgi:hypothetical protein